MRTPNSRKILDSGLTELEEAYGMSLEVKVPSGKAISTVPTARERVIASRRAGGQRTDQGTLSATKITDDVAVITARLPHGGYRTVAVATGGRVIELFRVVGVPPRVAREHHVRIVRTVREYLGDEGIVDFSVPLIQLIRQYGSNPF